MSSTTAELVQTGIVMGIIYVLTGPDHLSALATLSGTLGLGRGHKDTRREAFLLGIRWGIGHSCGLLLLGGILIAIEEESGEWIGMDPTLRMVMEGFVGVFMLALGAYGLFKADRNCRESVLGDLNHRPGGSVARASRGLKENEVEIMETRLESSGESSDDDDDNALFPSMTLPTKDNQKMMSMDDVLNSLDQSHYEDMDLPLSLPGSQHGLDEFRRSTNTDDRSTDECLADYLGADCLESVCGPSDMSFVTVPMNIINMNQSNETNAKLGRVPTKNTSRPPMGKLMSAQNLMQQHTDGSILTDATRDRGGMYEKYIFCVCGNSGRNFFLSGPGTLALAAGVLHGAAGPGGVLGVIPAVELRNVRLAVIYLGTFCLTSTCVMGGFAAFYSGLSGWLAGGEGSRSRVFVVEAGSALLSVSVGFIWLILLGLGKLDQVFP